MLNLISSLQTVVRCAILIAVMLPLSGCGKSTESPDVTFERGNLAVAAGEMESAVRHFTAALEKVPGRSDIAYERGRAYEALGLLEKAITDYQTCLNQEPNFEGAINNMGVCFAKLKQYDSAITQFSKLIELSAQNVLALRNRGLCYHDTQQFKAALVDYAAALEVDPADPESWFQQGNVYLENHDDQRAFESYSEAVRHDDRFAKAWMNRGLALFGLDRQAEGMKDLLKAAELDENIIIPDLDWVALSSATPPSQRMSTTGTDTVVGKAIFTGEVTADWNQIQRDSEQILLSRSFEVPTLQTSVPSEQCGILSTSKAGQKFHVYVGVMHSGSAAVQLPVDSVPADVHRSLLVVKFDQQQGKFVLHQFVENWQPTKSDLSVATVKVKLP